MRNLHEVITNFLVYIGIFHISANVLCKDKSICPEYNKQFILGTIIIIMTNK